MQSSTHLLTRGSKVEGGDWKRPGLWPASSDSPTAGPARTGHMLQPLLLWRSSPLGRRLLLPRRAWGWGDRAGSASEGAENGHCSHLWRWWTGSCVGSAGVQGLSQRTPWPTTGTHSGPSCSSSALLEVKVPLLGGGRVRP